MTPEQIAVVAERHAYVLADLDALRAAPPANDGSKAAKRAMSDWTYDVQTQERMLDQLGRTLKAAAPPAPRKPRAARGARGARGEVASAGEERRPWVQDGIAVASIPKGKRAELRFSINEWQGLRTIDLRTWFQPASGGDWGPSRKGVT
ncbi:MAG: hypothetical protein EOO29_54900, partial [Comamonadaceae bacterium]